MFYFFDYKENIAFFHKVSLQCVMCGIVWERLTKGNPMKSEFFEQKKNNQLFHRTLNALSVSLWDVMISSNNEFSRVWQILILQGFNATNTAIGGKIVSYGKNQSF